jgi:hypothetical protein
MAYPLHQALPFGWHYCSLLERLVQVRLAEAWL